MRNLHIAAAIAATLAASAAAEAAAPTIAQCAAPNYQVYVAGSSAAQNAFANALATDLFGGAANELVFSATSGTGNFKAYCGTVSAGNTAGMTSGNIAVVHYRAEGGSVVGALPVVSQKPIKFLDLTNAGVTSTTVSVTGTSATVGTTDGWGGALTTHVVEIGITDVEPGAFTTAGGNYPTAYSTAVFGSASAAQLGGLTKTPLFQQVFGIYVNPTGITPAITSLNLSRDTIANILEGNYFDWSSVPTLGGGRVSTASVPITVVNREAGSGSRTATSIYFLRSGCGGTGGSLIADPTPSTDGYATGDVLTTASTTGGALTYASIDNVKAPLIVVSIDGTPASNLNATSGDYGFWFEAQMISNTTALAANTTGGSLFNTYFPKILGAVATAPHTANVLAIPNIQGNTPVVPVVANGSPAIYVNPFTRSNVSCNVPVETN